MNFSILDVMTEASFILLSVLFIHLGHWRIEISRTKTLNDSQELGLLTSGFWVLPGLSSRASHRVLYCDRYVSEESFSFPESSLRIKVMLSTFKISSPNGWCQSYWEGRFKFGKVERPLGGPCILLSLLHIKDEVRCIVWVVSKTKTYDINRNPVFLSQEANFDLWGPISKIYNPLLSFVL